MLQDRQGKAVWQLQVRMPGCISPGNMRFCLERRLQKVVQGLAASQCTRAHGHLHLKYLQMESVKWRRAMGLLQLVHEWVMLGLSWRPWPAAVEAIEASMMEAATSPGIKVYGSSGFLF